MTTHCCPSYPCPICHASAIYAAQEQLRREGVNSFDYFSVVKTWEVIVKRGEKKKFIFRVPETNLDSFLHVLTFNKCEFEVKEESPIYPQQEITND